MRKPAAGLALLAALFAGATLELGATPASADHPNTVCSYWAHGETSGDRAVHHVRADWMAGRSFRVTVTDLTLLAAASEAADAYAPLPLEPNLRLSTNTVAVGDGLAVSDISISQGVAVSQAADGTPGQIYSYRKLPHAPWEAASVNGGEILWLHDIDARSDEAGAQGRPSDLPSPTARAADAAGVLDFTVTVPESVSGEVWLLRGMSSTSTGGSLAASPEQWIPGATSTRTLPGCSVTVEAAVAPQQEPAPAERAPAERPPAKKPGKTRSADSDTRGAAKHGTDKRGAAKPGAANDDAADNKRRDSASEERGGSTQRESSAGSQTQPPPTGTNGSETSASEPAGDAVARSGGANSAPWLVAAGAAVAVGSAVGIASHARTHGRRDAPGTGR